MLERLIGLPGWAWALVGAIPAAVAMWQVQEWRLGAEVYRQTAACASERAQRANATIASMQASAGAVAAAASAVADAAQRSARADAQAAQALRGYVQAHPLPVGCERDEVRQEAIRAAVERAKGVQ